MNESLAVEIQSEKQICTRTQFKDYPDVPFSRLRNCSRCAKTRSTS
jgi:hypothetical protein